MIVKRGGGSTRTVGANGVNGRVHEPHKGGSARISIITYAQPKCRLEKVLVCSNLRIELTTTLKKPDQSLAAATRALRVSPDHDRALAVRGTVY
jgi:hypothetical protein